jgi:hypothetical protein
VSDEGGPARPIDDPRAIAILTAEHSSLTAARSLNQAEMAGRATMFVASLSGSMVAIAFVAQATDFGSETAIFALLLLSIVLFLGVTTFIRAVDLSAEEVRWVAAMNRIRWAYAQAVPGLADYFTTLRHEPRSGVIATLSPVRESLTSVYGIATTPGVIAVIDSVLSATLLSVVLVSQGVALAPTLAGAVVAFLIVLAAHVVYGNRVFRGAVDRA